MCLKKKKTCDQPTILSISGKVINEISAGNAKISTNNSKLNQEIETTRIIKIIEHINKNKLFETTRKGLSIFEDDNSKTNNEKLISKPATVSLYDYILNNAPLSNYKYIDIFGDDTKDEESTKSWLNCENFQIKTEENIISFELGSNAITWVYQTQNKYRWIRNKNIKKWNE